MQQGQIMNFTLSNSKLSALERFTLLKPFYILIRWVVTNPGCSLASLEELLKLMDAQTLSLELYV